MTSSARWFLLVLAAFLSARQAFSSTRASSPLSPRAPLLGTLFLLGAFSLFATPDALAGHVPIPTNVQVEARNNSFVVSWDEVPGATVYRVGIRRKGHITTRQRPLGEHGNPLATHTTWTSTDRVRQDSGNSHTLGNYVQNGVTYQIRVGAVGDGGHWSGNSAWYDVTPRVPPDYKLTLSAEVFETIDEENVITREVEEDGVVEEGESILVTATLNRWFDNDDNIIFQMGLYGTAIGGGDQDEMNCSSTPDYWVPTPPDSGTWYNVEHGGNCVTAGAFILPARQSEVSFIIETLLDTESDEGEESIIIEAYLTNNQFTLRDELEITITEIPEESVNPVIVEEPEVPVQVTTPHEQPAISPPPDSKPANDPPASNPRPRPGGSDPPLDLNTEEEVPNEPEETEEPDTEPPPSTDEPPEDPDEPEEHEETQETEEPVVVEETAATGGCALGDSEGGFNASGLFLASLLMLMVWLRQKRLQKRRGDFQDIF